MEFNTLVKTQLYPTLQMYGFDIIEEIKNFVRFQSSKIEINIVFNAFENTNYISIGRHNEILYPINDDAVRTIFNSELQIEQVTLRTFIQNILIIFQQKEGIKILKGNIEPFIDFKLTEIKAYNVKLMYKQTLEAASNAWKNNDYKTYIKLIKEIGIEKVPKSYQLKYKIAKEKLE